MTTSLEYHSEIATSRFNVLATPERKPGTCGVCGTIHGPVVDLGINLHQLNYVHTVYICVSCLTEAKRISDLATGATQDEEAIFQAKLESYLLENDYKVITGDQYSAIGRVLSKWSDLVSGVSDDLVAEEVPQPGTEPDEGEPESADSNVSLDQLELDFLDGEDDRKVAKSLPDLTI